MNRFLEIVKYLVATVLLAVFAAPAQAAVVIFSDKASFLASTGAESATGALPSSGGDPQTVGSITFDGLSPSSNNFGGTADFWSSLIPGHDLALNGAENFDIIAAVTVYAMGFDAHEPATPFFGGRFTDTCGVSACVDTTFEITFLNGASLVGSQSVNFADNTLAFFGVWSDIPFDRFLVRDTNRSNDDEFFGQVYTSHHALITGVPEPMTLGLLGAGLAGIGMARRRR